MDTGGKLATMGLVGMLSEMKNPLTSIRLCIDLIESGAEPERDYFEMIKKNAATLEKDLIEMCNYFNDGRFSLKIEHEDDR
jgi:hypothetical protein